MNLVKIKSYFGKFDVITIINNRLLLNFYSSLPHRQLRNSFAEGAADHTGSLPHRQLRNEKLDPNGTVSSSLPHRQLRN